MIFKRRTPADWREKLRVAIWPRRSWGRSLKYLAKRVLRLTASPHAIAAGIAAGVFASFTPFMGLHFIISFAVAYLIAGNFIAAATGTFIGNPLTFPFIWAGTYSTGNLILGSQASSEGPEQYLLHLMHSSILDTGKHGLWSNLIGIWEPVLKPMTVGAFPLGIGLGLIFYILTRMAATAFQVSRRKLLADKARLLKERAIASMESQETSDA